MSAPAYRHDTHTRMAHATQEPIAHNLAGLRTRIAATATLAHRDPAAVRLLAVTKTRTAADIEAAWRAGQMEYGENYLQDAIPKIDALRHCHDLVWHFIGALQSNKTRPVAERFAWVHTLDRERIAQRLNAQRPASLAPLNVCLQVRLAAEPGKGGVLPERIPALAGCIAALPRLRLRGLMTLPDPTADAGLQRRPFRHLRELLETLNGSGYALDTLSMGTSADFESAIMEGATLIRLGTAIFGPRTLRDSRRRGQPVS